MRTNLVKSNIKLKNKLHAQLLHHYPNYNEFFFQIGGLTALAFWETYPSPNLLSAITKEELKTFLHTASAGKLRLTKADKIYDLVQNYNLNTIDYQEERNILIKMLVKQIRVNNEQITEIEKSILSLYDKLDKKLHTLIGLSKMTSAEILSEIGNIERFKNSGKLARYAGIAPIDFSSGNHDKSMRNEYGNRSLNSFIYYLACRSITTGKQKANPYSPIFLEYYHRKIREGKSKQQAITCIMRRLINIIYRILKDNIEYTNPVELANNCKNQYLNRIQNKVLN